MPIALITTIISLLPTITTGVSHLISWILEVRGAAGQTGQWTPELEEAFLKSLSARLVNPAYQPDKPD